MTQLLFVLLSILCLIKNVHNQDIYVETVAGRDSAEDGPASWATFQNPSGLAVDQNGTVFVVDSGNNKVRMIFKNGTVSTLAGNGLFGSTNGNPTVARFYNPYGITVDENGNAFVTDTYAGLIRKITANGTVSTLAGNGSKSSVDGQGSRATFNGPWDLTVDSAGNLYVAEYHGRKIRKITPDGFVSTVAGNGSISSADGPGLSATFNRLESIAILPSGELVVSDTGNHKIRKIALDGTVSTIAGTGSVGLNDGLGTVATFNGPRGITADSNGNIFVADTGNNRIRQISPNGTVSSLATAGLEFPFGLTIDGDGNLYVSERNNHKIKKILPNGTVLPFAGYGSSVDGRADLATFWNPNGIALDSRGDIFVADTDNNKIRKISIDGNVSTIAGTGISGSTNGPGVNATFAGPIGITIDSNENLYVCDNRNQRIRRISPDGVVSTFAGNGSVGSADGQGSRATFNSPHGITVDLNNNIYVSEASGTIRKIMKNGNVSTLAGNGSYGDADGPANLATFNFPNEVAVDSVGNLYVADKINHRIRKVSIDGTVTTVAGTGVHGFRDGPATEAQFNQPSGIAVNAYGEIFVTEMQNMKIRKITLDGMVVTIAGGSLAKREALDGYGPIATFYYPTSVALTKDGHLYIADKSNNKIRKIWICTGKTAYLFGQGCVCITGYEPSANGTCLPCSAGTFKNSTGNLPCLNCINSYSSNLGSANCVPCPENAVCPSPFTGFYCTAGYEPDGKDGCAPCRQSFFKNGTGNQGDRCISCPSNAVCNTTSFSCVAGFFLDEQQVCALCPEGQYKSVTGNQECSICPANAKCSPTNFNCNDGYQREGATCKPVEQLRTDSVDSSLAMITSITISLFFVTLFGLVGLYYYRTRKKVAKKSKVDEAPTTVISTQHSTTTSIVSAFETQTTVMPTLMSDQTTVLAVPGYLSCTPGDYRCLRELKRGGEGVVFVGELLSRKMINEHNTVTIVIKRMHENRSETARAQYQKEIAIMGLLSKHQFFAEILGFDPSTVSILMRYYPCGSLETFLHRPKTLADMKIQVTHSLPLHLKLALDISKGIKVMHEHHMAHCDLKPDNILMKYDQPRNEWTALISDFGISRLDERASKVNAFVIPDVNGASLAFAPPEMLDLLKVGNPNGRSFPVLQCGDIYSHGCILYELFTEQTMWNDMRTKKHES